MTGQHFVSSLATLHLICCRYWGHKACGSPWYIAKVEALTKTKSSSSQILFEKCSKVQYGVVKSAVGCSKVVNVNKTGRGVMQQVA